MPRISPVLQANQREEPLYQFFLTVEDLHSICRVERFHETTSGVQRKLDPKHVEEMVNAMIENPEVLFMQNILGDLVGPWEYDEESSALIGGEEAYISIDDGGHRYEAFQVLNAEEQKRWMVSVMVTHNLPLERRMKLFWQQMEQKRLDPRLTYAQRHRINRWESDRDRECYELCIMLNGQPDSPLYQLILLDEQLKQPYEHRHRPIGINVMGLMTTLRPVLGVNSPLSQLSADRRAQVITTYLRIAKAIWPHEWKSEKHILTSAKGIRPLLQLFISSPNFRGALGDNFSPESLEHALRFAETYNWTETHNHKKTIAQIVEALDQSIARNKNKQARESRHSA